MSEILAWHFVGCRLRDGRPVPPDGETLRHDGAMVLCESGLHASERPIGALEYAPGETLCRVRCGGDIVCADDKMICRERTILWRFDATELLREFARLCALDVAPLWAAPEIVLDYLRTGDEAKMAASSAAAWDAWDAASPIRAVWGAAWAAWAAWAAAASAPYDAAAAAARAARGAAAASDAARGAAHAAAAANAAHAAQSKRLDKMVARAAEARGFTAERAA